jgi:hypothetical protein
VYTQACFVESYASDVHLLLSLHPGVFVGASDDENVGVRVGLNAEKSENVFSSLMIC